MSFPLNLPITPLLDGCQNVLLCGTGGDYDVYAGLPIYQELQNQGKTVHLANYSFVEPGLAKVLCDDHVEIVKDLLVGVRGLTVPVPYFPEGYLAQWFADELDRSVTIWLIRKVGVPGVKRALQRLVQHLGIDAIVLCDGGVDSLMRGDETNPGTLLEDAISLTAASSLENVPVKVLAAIGMGTEVEERLSHYSALENIAALARVGGYHGTCALTPGMPAFRFYESAARYVFEKRKAEPSRIHTRIIPSVRGDFGPPNGSREQGNAEVFLSPLMGLYWFFDVDRVVSQSELAQVLVDIDDFSEATQRGLAHLVRRGDRRQRRDIPLL